MSTETNLDDFWEEIRAALEREASGDEMTKIFDDHGVTTENIEAAIASRSDRRSLYERARAVRDGNDPHVHENHMLAKTVESEHAKDLRNVAVDVMDKIGRFPDDVRRQVLNDALRQLNSGLEVRPKREGGTE